MKKRQLQAWSRLTDVKLSAIRIKCSNNRSALTGIQFVYQNGFESPLFQTDGAIQNNIIYTVNLDTSKTVRKVSIKVDEQKIGGLRLYDENNEFIMNSSWSSDRRGHWITKSIQSGLEIIGLQCNTNYMRIMNLGFLLWRPRPQVMTISYGLSTRLDEENSDDEILLVEQKQINNPPEEIHLCNYVDSPP